MWNTGKVQQEKMVKFSTIPNYLFYPEHFWKSESENYSGQWYKDLALVKSSSDPFEDSDSFTVSGMPWVTTRHLLWLYGSRPNASGKFFQYMMESRTRDGDNGPRGFYWNNSDLTVVRAEDTTTWNEDLALRFYREQEVYTFDENVMPETMKTPPEESIPEPATTRQTMNKQAFKQAIDSREHMKGGCAA